MKRWLKILTAVLLLAAVTWMIYRVAQRPAPPASGPIVLPDGSWVHIEAVTYGTNHLVGPPLAHVAGRLPQPMRNLMTRYLGRRAAMRFSATTSSPKLVLWLNRGVSAAPFPSSTGYLECVLSDTNGFTCGDRIPFEARYPLTVTEFSVFPRRAPELTLSIYYHDSTGAVFKRGSVAFANPVYNRYPEWKAESLPATKRAGDVEVTLEQLSAGHSDNYEYKRRPGGGREIIFSTNGLDGGSATVCFLRVRPLVNTNEVWRVAQVRTRDATGNQIASTMLGGEPEEGWLIFSPALWPDEAAWKLSMELKRAAGFKAEEQFTFRNVPLGALNSTNRPGWTTNCNGVTVTLNQFVHQPPPANPNRWSSREVSQLHLLVSGLTNDLRLDLLSARTDIGTKLNCGTWSSSDGKRAYHFRDIPTNATTADFTFTVQRSRWVEFLVKPETGEARLEVAPKIKP